MRRGRDVEGASKEKPHLIDSLSGNHQQLLGAGLQPGLHVEPRHSTQYPRPREAIGTRHGDMCPGPTAGTWLSQEAEVN